LNFIVPDRVHVLVDGRIVRSGGKELALELEEKGYAWLESLARSAPGAAAQAPAPSPAVPLPAAGA
jgi:Fe-S cluster assembly ATP-binding protein